MYINVYVFLLVTQCLNQLRHPVSRSGYIYIYLYIYYTVEALRYKP
jgi:hypothetical protein